MDPIDLKKEAERSFSRLEPRLESKFEEVAAAHPDDWQSFKARLEANFASLFRLLIQLYGHRYDFFFHLEDLVDRLTQSWVERPTELKELDGKRQSDRSWFQSNQMLGGMCYVDLFARDLSGLRSKIPYFQELGLNYLHLMPPFRVPLKHNDGGYAVSSYQEVDPRLGTVQELRELAGELRHCGISLVLDFVFNHTSNEHEWALKALSGDADYQEYYRMYPDRAVPEAFEQSLREIFPDEHRGAFTYVKSIDRWVWTTFHSYQWDLNYGNPAVFNEMAVEMLRLANLGVEVLRLDAVAFIWKEMGTSCENLPQAHQLIQAFNSVARIAAPALLFKSEAIVHPDEVIRYIHADECQLSYNPLTMALIWNSLATREVRLLEGALREHHQRLPEGCSWVNYVRCHDDIGWTFSDEAAARLGIDARRHREFLNQFYTGRFPGSFARGLPFQENPLNHDMRISGTCASLAGLEKALLEETPLEVDLAIRRILLIHGLILTIGGIPLIYLGDEIATLNDYSYKDDPSRANDSRWIHRLGMDWERAGRRLDPTTQEGQVFQGLQRLIQLRKANPAFAGRETQVMDTGNPHVLGYVRSGADQRALVFANFSEQPQTIAGNLLRLYGPGYSLTDLFTGEAVKVEDLVLAPYEFRCLAS